MLYKQTNFKHYLNQKALFDRNVYNLKKQIDLKRTMHPYKNKKIPGASQNQTILYMKCLTEQLQQEIQLHKSFNTKSYKCQKKMAQLSEIIKKMSIQTCFQTVLKVLYCCHSLNINNLNEYFNEQQIKTTIDLLYDSINQKNKKQYKNFNSKQKHSNSTENLNKFYQTHRHRELSSKKLDYNKTIKQKSETSRISKHQGSKKFIELILFYKIDEIFVYLEKIYLDIPSISSKKIFSEKFFQLVNQMISCSHKIKIFYSEEEFTVFEGNLKHLVKDTKQKSGFNETAYFQTTNRKQLEQNIYKKSSDTQMKRVSKSTYSNQQKISHGSLFKNGQNLSQEKRSSILHRQSLKSTKGIKRRSGIRGMDSQSKKRISTRWNNNNQGDIFGLSIQSKQKNFKRGSNFNLIKKMSSKHDSQFSNNYIQQNFQSVKDDNDLSDNQSKRLISQQSLYLKKMYTQFKSFYLYMKGERGVTLKIIKKTQVNKTSQIQNQQNLNKTQNNRQTIQLVAFNLSKSIFENILLVITQISKEEKDLKQSFKRILQKSSNNLFEKEPLLDDLFQTCIVEMIQDLFVIVNEKNGFKLRIKKGVLPLTKQLKLNYGKSIKIQAIPSQKIQSNYQTSTFALQHFDLVRKINTHFFRKLIFKKKTQKNPPNLAVNKIRFANQIVKIHERLKKTMKRQKRLSLQYFKEHSLFYIQQTYCNTFSVLYESKKPNQLQLNIFNHNIYGNEEQQDLVEQYQNKKKLIKYNKSYEIAQSYYKRRNIHKINNENLTKRNSEKGSDMQIKNDSDKIQMQNFNVICIQNSSKMNPSTIFIRQFSKKEKTSRYRSTQSNNQVSTKKINFYNGSLKTKYVSIKCSKQNDLQKDQQNHLSKFNIQQICQESFNNNTINPLIRKSKICFEQDKNKISSQFSTEEVQKINLMMDKIIQKSQEEDAEQEQTSRSLSKLKTRIGNLKKLKRSSSINLQLKKNIQANGQISSRLKSLVRISSQLQKRSKLSKSSRNFSSMHTLIGYNLKQYQVLFKTKHIKNCFQKKKLVKDGLSYVLCILTIINLVQKNQPSGKYLEISIQYGINQKKLATLKKKKIKVLSQSVKDLLVNQKSLDIFILKHIKNRFSLNQNLIKQPDFFFSDLIDTYKVISFLKKIKYQTENLYLISNIKVFSEEVNQQIYMQTYIPTYSKYFLYIIPAANFFRIISMFLNNFNSKKILTASLSKSIRNQNKLINKKSNNKRLSIWQRQNTPKKYQEDDEKYFLEQIKQMNSIISSVNSQSFTQKLPSEKIFQYNQKELYQKLNDHKHKSRLSQYFRFKEIDDNLIFQMGTDSEIYKFQASQILTKKLHFDCYTLKKKSKSSKQINKQNAIKICENKYLNARLNQLIIKPSAFQIVLLKHPVIKNLNNCKSFSYQIMKQLQLKKMYIKCDSALYHEQHSSKKILQLVADDVKSTISINKMNSMGFSFQKSIIFSTLSMLKQNQGEGFIKRSKQSKFKMDLQSKKKTGVFLPKPSFESNGDKFFENLKHKILTYKDVIEYSKKIQQNFSEVIKKQQKQKNSIIYIPASQYCQESQKQFKVNQINESNRFKFVKLRISSEEQDNFLSQKVKKLYVMSIYNQPLSEINITYLKEHYPYIENLGFRSLKKFLLRLVRDQTMVKNKRYEII